VHAGSGRDFEQQAFPAAAAYAAAKASSSVGLSESGNKRPLTWKQKEQLETETNGQRKKKIEKATDNTYKSKLPVFCNTFCKQSNSLQPDYADRECASKLTIFKNCADTRHCDAKTNISKTKRNPVTYCPRHGNLKCAESSMV
jgi:hypothetical protein